MAQGNGANNPPLNLPPGGLLWVINADGSVRSGFPYATPLLLGGDAVWSSPSIADMNGDGFPDIVFGSGLNWGAPWGQWVYAIDRTGQALHGFPVRVGGQVMATPAIGAVTQGGAPMIVALADDGNVYGINHVGHVVWTRCVRYQGTTCQVNVINGIHGAASIADVNNDGVMDVVVAAEKWIYVYRLDNGALEASGVLDNDAQASPSQPTIANINGHTWILENTLFGAPQRVQGASTQRIYRWTTGTAPGRFPWPTFKGNMTRSGIFNPNS
jgi:hypothetical protein